MGSNLVVRVPRRPDLGRDPLGPREPADADRGGRAGDRPRGGRRGGRGAVGARLGADDIRQPQLVDGHPGRYPGLHRGARVGHRERPDARGPRTWTARRRSPSSGTRSGTACSGDTDPIGETIRIKKVPFTVVGMLEPKGQSAFGQDQDDLILIPLSTAKKKVLGTNRSNPRSVGQISVRVRDASLMEEAEEQIRRHPPAAPPPASQARTTTSRCGSSRRCSRLRRSRRAS